MTTPGQAADAEVSIVEERQVGQEQVGQEQVGQEQVGQEQVGQEQLDRWLAAAAADRDEGAFEQLVRRHTPALYAGALRTTGSEHIAQDVVQEAWLSAWLHLPGFRGQSQVRTWLVRIATTKALNALRRPERTVPLETAPEPRAASTEQQVEQRERADAVRAAVAALPARQREAVVLRDLEGLSYEQVAAALDCSVGSVKSALFRGRQSLALALAHHQPGVEPEQQQHRHVRDRTPGGAAPWNSSRPSGHTRTSSTAPVSAGAAVSVGAGQGAALCSAGQEHP